MLPAGSVLAIAKQGRNPSTFLNKHKLLSRSENYFRPKRAESRNTWNAHIKTCSRMVTQNYRNNKLSVRSGFLFTADSRCRCEAEAIRAFLKRQHLWTQWRVSLPTEIYSTKQLEHRYNKKRHKICTMAGKISRPEHQTPQTGKGISHEWRRRQSWTEENHNDFNASGFHGFWWMVSRRAGFIISCTYSIYSVQRRHSFVWQI